MGGISSKPEEHKVTGKVYGHWADGTELYEQDFRKLSADIISKKYAIVDGNAPEPIIIAFSLKHFDDDTKLDEKMYYRTDLTPDTIKRIKIMYNNLPIVGKVAGSVKNIIGIILPLIISLGRDEAKRRVRTLAGSRFSSDDLAKIDNTIDSISDELNTLSPVKVGSGRRRTSANKSDYIYRHLVNRNGGCNCRIGGEESDVKEVTYYINSNLSKTKEQIVDNIISAMEKLGVVVKGADLSSKISSILDQLPDGKNRIIKADDAVQSKLCVAIGNALNKSFGDDVINTNASPVEICKQIVEVIKSLNVGLQSEFLGIYNNAKRSLYNVNVLAELLDTLKVKVDKYIDDNNLGTQGDALKNFMEIHKQITNEIKRQRALLDLLLTSSIDDPKGDISKYIQKNIDLDDFISKHKISTGTREFSTVVANTLQSIGVTAQYVLMVEKALKTMNMKMDEYLNLKTFAELRQKISSGLSDDMSSEALHEYLTAAELLYENLNKRDDISVVLEAKKIKGSADFLTNVERQANNIKTERSLIITGLIENVLSHMGKMVDSLVAISKNIGTDEVPLSEQLTAFKQSLKSCDLSGFTDKNNYKALIGFHKDTFSLTIRNNLINQLKLIKAHCETIIEMPLYAKSKQYFEKILHEITEIISIIETHHSKFSAKFGGAEGGLDDLFTTPITHYKSHYSFADAVNSFEYYFRTAHIKHNLKNAQSEFSKYADDGSKITTEAIASYISNINKTYNDLIAELGKIKKMDYNHFMNCSANPIVTVLNMPSRTDIDKYVDDAILILNDQYNSKIKFWATVEAIEIYLKLFTNGISTKPDISTIKNMLDNVEVISNWYNDDIGLNIMQLFNKFPSGNTNYAATPLTLGTLIDNEYKDQSFDSIFNEVSKVDGQLDVGKIKKLPGIPIISALPAKGIEAKNIAKSVVGNIQALKNLLSIVMHISTVSNDNQIKNKMFMTPTQIYNNLVEYLYNSAFVVGFGDHKDFAVSAMGAAHEIVLKYTPDTNRAAHTSSQHSGGVATVISTYDLAYGIGGITPDGTLGDVVGITLHTNPTAVEATQNYFRHVFSRVGVMMSVDNRYYNNKLGFTVENEHFSHIIKALCAKVMTVLGLYDIFDRPQEYNLINDTRIIIGANDSLLPVIIDDATQLYLRLPLLAEFYKELFSLSNFENLSPLTKDWKLTNDKTAFISMLPDINGPFTGLIKLIFRDKKNVPINQYTNMDFERLIDEVNLIYQRFSSTNKDNITYHIINEFVNEINRRYGLITKSQLNKYIIETNENLNYKNAYSNTDNPDVDYPILPGEDLGYGPSSLSPAQRLANIGTLSIKEGKDKILTEGYYEVLSNFRKLIDNKFVNQNEAMTDLTIELRSAIDNLKKLTDKQQRFNTITTLIRGYNNTSNNSDAACLIFHEVVVTGLNTISLLHTYLSRFIKRVDMISPKNIMGHIYKKLDEIVLNNAITNWGAFIDACNDSYETDGALSLRALLGQYKEQPRYGGHTRKFQYAIPHDVDIYGPFDGKYVFPKFYEGTVNAALETQLGHPHPLSHQGKLIDIDHTGGDLTATLKCTLVALMYGGANGVTITRMLDKYDKDYDKDDVASRLVSTISRYLPDRQFIMNEIIELVIGLSNDTSGLVEFNKDNDNIYISYSKLKEQVGILFATIDSFIGILRPYISETVIAKYVEKNNIGSFYWLHEHLIERIFNGNPTMDDGKLKTTDTLDDTVKKLSDIYKDCTQKWPVDGKGLHRNINRTANDVGTHVAVAPAWAGANPNAYPTISFSTDNTNRINYKRTFDKLLFYDILSPVLMPSDDNNVRITGNIPTTDIPNIEYIRPKLFNKNNPYDMLIASGTHNNRTLDLRFICRFKHLYSWTDEINNNKSILFTFNQLIARHIYLFYNTISSKIYSGLIMPLTQGSLSYLIGNYKENFPDVAPLYYISVNKESDSLSSILEIPLLPEYGGYLDQRYFTNANNYDPVNVASDIYKSYIKHGSRDFETRYVLNRYRVPAALTTAAIMADVAFMWQRSNFLEYINTFGDSNHTTLIGAELLAGNIIEHVSQYGIGLFRKATAQTNNIVPNPAAAVTGLAALAAVMGGRTLRRGAYINASIYEELRNDLAAGTAIPFTHTTGAGGPPLNVTWCLTQHAIWANMIRVSVFNVDPLVKQFYKNYDSTPLVAATASDNKGLAINFATFTGIQANDGVGGIASYASYDAALANDNLINLFTPFHRIAKFLPLIQAMELVANATEATAAHATNHAKSTLLQNITEGQFDIMIISFLRILFEALHRTIDMPGLTDINSACLYALVGSATPKVTGGQHHVGEYLAAYDLEHNPDLALALSIILRSTAIYDPLTFYLMSCSYKIQIISNAMGIAGTDVGGLAATVAQLGLNGPANIAAPPIIRQHAGKLASDVFPLAPTTVSGLFHDDIVRMTMPANLLEPNAYGADYTIGYIRNKFNFMNNMNSFDNFVDAIFNNSFGGQPGNRVVSFMFGKFNDAPALTSFDIKRNIMGVIYDMNLNYLRHSEAGVNIHGLAEAYNANIRMHDNRLDYRTIVNAGSHYYPHSHELELPFINSPFMRSYRDYDITNTFASALTAAQVPQSTYTINALNRANLGHLVFIPNNTGHVSSYIHNNFINMRTANHETAMIKVMGLAAACSDLISASSMDLREDYNISFKRDTKFELFKKWLSYYKYDNNFTASDKIKSQVSVLLSAYAYRIKFHKSRFNVKPTSTMFDEYIKLISNSPSVKHNNNILLSDFINNIKIDTIYNETTASDIHFDRVIQEGLNGILMYAINKDIELIGANKIDKDNYKNMLGINVPAGNFDNSIWGPRYEPGNRILFMSLSHILNNIINTRLPPPTNALYHINELADLSLRDKEIIKESCGSMSALFMSLLERCRILRSFLEDKQLLVKSFECGQNETFSKWPHFDKPYENQGELLNDKYAAILDIYMRACNDFIKMYANVLRDVSDQPKYLELYDGSLSEYKLFNRADALTPLSSTLNVFRNLEKNEVLTRLLPSTNMNKSDFKFIYGMRSIFNNPNTLTIESVSGIKDIIDRYNVLATNKFAITNEQFSTFLSTFGNILKYLYNCRAITSQLTPYVAFGYGTYDIFDKNHARHLQIEQQDGHFLRGALVLDDKTIVTRDPRVHGVTTDLNIFGTNNISVVNNDKTTVTLVSKNMNSPKSRNTTYSILNSTDDVVTMTEKINRITATKLITNLACDISLSSTIDRLTSNVLELNIMPINIHAMMRDIPLASLYNYSYTFDKFVKSIYGINNDIGATINSTTEMLASTIITPYREINEYDTTHYHNMMVGDNIGLGRPKLLSDHIYNSILGSLYSTSASDHNNSILPVPNKDTNILQVFNETDKYIYQFNKYVTSASNFNGAGANAPGNSISATIYDVLLPDIIARANTLVLHNVQAKWLLQTILDEIKTSNLGIALRATNNNLFDKYVPQLIAQTLTLKALVYLAYKHNNNINIHKTILFFATCLYTCTGTIASDNRMRIKGYGQGAVAANVDLLTPALFLPLYSAHGRADAAPPGVNQAETGGAVTYVNAKTFYNAGPSAANPPADYEASKAAALSMLSRLFDITKPVKDPANFDADTFAAVLHAISNLDIYTLSEEMGGSGSSIMFNAANAGNNNLYKDLTKFPFKDIDTTFKNRATPPTIRNNIILEVYTKNDPNDPYGNIILKQYALTGDFTRDIIAVNRFARRNTTFIQNIVFIVNCYRTLRMKLQSDLIYTKDIIAKAQQIVNPKITEFYGNQTQPKRHRI